MHFISHARSLLLSSGFTELQESEPWPTLPDSFFVVRDERHLFAIRKHDFTSAVITASSIFPPCFKTKPKTHLTRFNFEQIRVAPFGISTWAEWFDRDLKIAGEVVHTSPDNSYHKSLFNSPDPIGVIPSLAYHLSSNRAQAIATINLENEAVPIIAIQSPIPTISSHHSPLLLENISSTTGIDPQSIVDLEVSFYDANPVQIIGTEDDFIAGARLSDIGVSYLALKAFVEADAPTRGFTGFIASDGVRESRYSLSSTLVERVFEKVEKLNGLQPKFLFLWVGTVAAEHPLQSGNVYVREGTIGKGLVQSGIEGANLTARGRIQRICQKAGVKVDAVVDESQVGVIAFMGRRIGCNPGEIAVPVLSCGSVREFGVVKDFDGLFRVLKTAYTQNE